MPTWALPSTNSYYRHALLRDIYRNHGTNDPEKLREWYLRYLLETEELNTCVSYATPVEDVTKRQLQDMAALVHVGNSSITARISALHGSSGLCNSGLYSLPYESSIYLNSVKGYRSLQGFPFMTFHDMLQYEIVNGMCTMYTWDRRQSILLKPTGESNGGIEGLEVTAQPYEDRIQVITDILFKVYPSCLFYPSLGFSRQEILKADDDDEEYGTDPANPFVKLKVHIQNRRRFKRPISYLWERPKTAYSSTYDFSNGYFMPYTPDGEDIDYRRRGANQYLYRNWKQMTWRDGHITELRSAGNLMYVRSVNGIYIGKYQEGNEPVVETLNNLHYEERDRVHFMHPNPFIYSECAMLCGNSLLLYDATTAIESNHYALKLGDSEGEDIKDISQTICYGMNMHTLILGGERLYTFDFRVGKPEDLFLKVDKEIRVNSTRQSERVCDNLKLQVHQMASYTCGFNNYWKSVRPSFWSAFTAISAHPLYRNIIATVYCLNDCIYIWDLRAPIKPLLEIPLSSTENLGARYRELRWSVNEDGSGSVLLAFCWRHKHPLACSFRINNAITHFEPAEPQDDERQYWNNWVQESNNDTTNVSSYWDINSQSSDSSSTTDDDESTGDTPPIERVGPLPRKCESNEEQDLSSDSDNSSSSEGTIQREAKTYIQRDNQESQSLAGLNTETLFHKHSLLRDFASGKVFEDVIEIELKHCIPLQLTRISKEHVDKAVDSVGPLIERPEDYAAMPIKTTQKELLLPIFHGYAGITTLESGQCQVVIACTSSGSLFAMDLSLSKRIECLKPSRSFDFVQRKSRGSELFKYIKSSSGSLFIPQGFITGETDRVIPASNVSLCSKPQYPIIIICLNKTFVDVQEAECLPLSADKNRFDSEAILRRLLSQKYDGFDEGGSDDIMSLHRFERTVGSREKLEDLAVNVWDTAEFKMDFEYDTSNVNNHFLDPTPECHCFVQDNPNTQIKALSAYLNALKLDPDGAVTVGPVENIDNIPTEKENTLFEYLSQACKSGLESGVPIEIPQGKVHSKEIVESLLFHSPVLPKVKNNDEVPSKRDGVHKHYCGVNHLVGIKLRKENDIDLGDRIQSLLDTWRTTADDGGEPGSGGMYRFHTPPDQIAVLRNEQLERDRLVEHLLSQGESSQTS
ncbi:hypothetical protein BBOV_II004310 [Babesia bovis T2Bo]|uniref:Uncharacterized protein n=1 Tax=Babesia bovis TaxID=5865 RepID=A7ATX5_BABBO|nr:hypothetical protein BBOV_II004310 [Babesia bovis T2Bo]EDO06386.1 hypothetical protein BBOV_II004310 [Babesia bovis T2Bo]|eukprot:XP_001609954.1 hypothetical protein [Babesia bovis T2Bo]